MTGILTPFFPCEWAELLAYLNRAVGAGEGDSERVIRAANHAAGYAERRTNRRLTARVYRAAAAIASCATTISDTDVTGTGFTAGVKALDEVTGVGLQPGTRVASVTSNTALVLDRPALATGTVSLTFGSERLAVDGSGSQVLMCPEYPVQELYSAAYLDSDGTETALDTTAYRIGRTGRIYFPNDTFPEGELNILIGCRAGYQEPSATYRGDFNDWQAIQHMHLRLAQVFFQDEASQPGRIVDRSIAQFSANVPDFKLPADIEELLAQFKRLW